MANLSKEQWQRLEPLLDELLDLDPSARAGRLAELAEGDPELAADLALMLAAEEQSSLDDGSSTPVADARASLSLPGTTIGPYRLLEGIGHGGMGSVWLAERSDGRFEGRVAIKFLNLALIGRGAEQRFQREGAVLARLTHPAIARLLDAGSTSTGQPYLVLEYVDGRPIDRHCDDHRLGVAERIRLLLQVMAAVSHAHQNLVVHRDLKPSNILVTGDGRPRLLDFGIAKLLETETGPADRSELTAVDGQALTPGFAAPEQVQGDPITTATDVYALGVLLHLLLSGEHPTGAEATSSASMLRSVVERSPVRLSDAAAANGKHPGAAALAALRGSTPERLRRSYRDDLDNILARALKKDPAERYATVASFATDLEHYLHHEPVTARPDSATYRLGKFARRHRGALAIAGVVAASLLGAAGFSVRQMREAQRQRDAALFDARRADAQIQFQELLMTDVGDRPMTMRELLDRGRDLLVRMHAGDSRFQAAIATQLATAYGDLGDSKIRSQLLARAESLARANNDTGQLLEAICDRGDNLRTMGEYPAAAAAFAEADSLMRGYHDPRAEADCLVNHANFYVETHPADSALLLATRAVAIFADLGDSTSVSSVDAVGTLADALEAQGRLREAAEAHRRAIAAMDKSGQGELMSRTIYLHNLGFTLRLLGRTAEADSVFHEVVIDAGRADPTGALPNQVLIHYAATALYQGQTDSAAKYFGMLAAQAVADSNLYWEGRARFGLALAQIRAGQLAAARESMTRFRAIARRKNLSSSDDELYDPAVLEARLLAATGKPGPARDRFLAALDSAGYSSGKRRGIFRPALTGAADASLAAGDPAQALALARATRAIVDRDTSATSTNAYVGETWLIEARALAATGDSAGALVAAQRARNGLAAGAGTTHPLTLEASALVAVLGGR
jgi:serine/threonine protein kinase